MVMVEYHNGDTSSMVDGKSWRSDSGESIPNSLLESKSGELATVRLAHARWRVRGWGTSSAEDGAGSGATVAATTPETNAAPSLLQTYQLQPP